MYELAKRDGRAARRRGMGFRSSLYQPLMEADVRRIANAAFRVLEQSGVKVFSSSGREAFQRAGAEVLADNVVRLPRGLVEDAIASNPSSITLYSRNGKNDCVLESNRVHYGTGGTALYVIDPDTGEHRPSTTADVILNARLAEVLDNVHLFTINVFPNEIREKDRIDVNRFFHSFNNTEKHVMGGIYSFPGLKKVVKMAEMIAGGAASLQRRPFVSFITLLISPFKIDRDYGDMTCHLAEKGLPVVVPTEPMCGTTSPITLAGNVLTHLAETLAGIAMVQCVNRGAPGICGSVGSISDLRTMGNLGGPIERAMINAAVAQMAQHFDLPLYSTAGTSDAKNLDIQAAYESAMSNLLVAMSGANYIHDAAGLMDFDLTVSYEKMVMDNEILGMCQRVLRGIEVNEDTLAADLIIEKGPGNDFLAEQHTVKHMRGEFFFPQISNREKREDPDAELDALARAKKVIGKVKNNGRQSMLPENLRRQIQQAFPEIMTDE